MSANSNVNPQEIDKFAQLASRWWDSEGEFKPLHEINPLRVDFIAQYSGGLFSKKVLDVGCGGGILSEALARMGADVTGLDMAEESLQVARLHGLESGAKVDYQLTTAESFAQNHQTEFDVVCCLEMLEHVPDPHSVVLACAQMVKPGGHVFFSTLNRNIKSYLMAIVGAEYVLNLVPKGTHDHKAFIKPSELIGWLDSTELKPSHMTGLHMNPLTRQYYLSDSNVDVNYLLHCQRLD